jgi:hypothetical protein
MSTFGMPTGVRSLSSTLGSGPNTWGQTRAVRARPFMDVAGGAFACCGCVVTTRGERLVCALTGWAPHPLAYARGVSIESQADRERLGRAGRVVAVALGVQRTPALVFTIERIMGPVREALSATRHGTPIVLTTAS